jgi:hypothetical protein
LHIEEQDLSHDWKPNKADERFERTGGDFKFKKAEERIREVVDGFSDIATFP